MLATLVKVMVALGSVAIAALSAFATYKKNAAAQARMNSDHSLAYVGYGGNYGYAYGGGYNIPRTPRIVRTGNIDQDLDNVTNGVNNQSSRVDILEARLQHMEAGISKIIALAEARRTRMQTPNPQIPVNEPVQETPVAPPVMNTAPIPDAHTLAWERAQDNAIIKINNGINPANDQPMNPTAMQNACKTALEYTYATSRAERFYDEDMRRRFGAGMNGTPTINPYASGNPYQNNGMIGCTTPVNPQIPMAPTIPMNQPSMMASPVNPDGSPTFEKPVRPTYYIGHFGEPMPSTRQTFQIRYLDV